MSNSKLLDAGMKCVVCRTEYDSNNKCKCGRNLADWPICTKCGNNRQVWVNQLTDRITCHRASCYIELDTMPNHKPASAL